MDQGIITFRMLSITAIVSVFFGITLHFTLASLPGLGGTKRFRGILRKLLSSHLQTMQSKHSNPFANFRNLVYFLGLLSFAASAISGLGPTLIVNKPLSGYFLLVHAVFGPIFAVCLVILGLMYAPRSCFTESDWRFLERHRHPEMESDNPIYSKSNLVKRLCFWIIILSALPMLLSVALGMFPLFGTYTQMSLMRVHRYSGLLLSIAVVIHTHSVILIETRRILEE